MRDELWLFYTVSVLLVHAQGEAVDDLSPHAGLTRKVDYVRNAMAHAQKSDFIFPRNGRVHLNRLGASVQSTTGSRGVRISGSNAGYTMFRGSVKSTGYPLHSPVFPSVPLPCVTVCHHISTGFYKFALRGWSVWPLDCLRNVMAHAQKPDFVFSSLFNLLAPEFYI